MSEPPRRALQWRPLHPEHLSAMHELHLLSIAGMAVQVVKPETIEFLHSLLRGRGRVIGAWQDEAGRRYEGPIEAVLEAPLEKLLWFRRA